MENALSVRQMLWLRGGGLIVVVLAASAAFHWGGAYPIVNVLASAVCLYVGKVCGVPAEAILRYALSAMHPDKAAQFTLDAVRSMPPAQAEDLARQIISSFPPKPTVVLVNTDAADFVPPPPPAPPPPPKP